MHPLSSALKDPARLVRGNAIQALREIRDSGAVDGLITALSDDDRHVREKAAEALAASGDLRAVEPLIALIQEDEYVILRAAEALGKIGDSRAVNPLIVLLDHRDGRLRKSVARALVGLYQGGRLDLQAKQQILAHRDSIESPHTDISHCWSDGHTTHTDTGIAVDFPL